MKFFKNVFSLLFSLLFGYFFIFSSFAQAQIGAEIGTLDTRHFIPPLYASSGTAINADVRDHYLWLSTPNLNVSTITVSDGVGVIGTVQIDRNNPALIDLSGGAHILGAAPLVHTIPATIGASGQGAKGIVVDTDLNTVNTSDGFILESAGADQMFYANIRQASSSQGGSLTAKGHTALGAEFRAGSLLGQCGNVDTRKNHFISIMAQTDDTLITFSDTADVTFETTPIAGNIYSPTVTLDTGESYVIGVKFSSACPAGEDVNGIFGTLITASDALGAGGVKLAVINVGSFLGGISAGGARDAGFDQILPTSYLGTEFVIAKGGGDDDNLERPVIVAHTNNTRIFINGGLTPVATLQAGEYFDGINGTSFPPNGAMVIRTDQPAYLYQSSNSNDSSNGMGLNFIPAVFPNLEQQEVAIPQVEQIGAAGIDIIVQVGGPITIEAASINGGAPTLLTAAPFNLAPSPLIGTSVFEIYRIPANTFADTESVFIESTGAFFTSLSVAEGARGAAGFFTGFPNSYAIRDDEVTGKNTPIAIPVASNDIAGFFDFSVVSTFNGPTNGTVVINPDNSITYTPSFDFLGADTFEYTIEDNVTGFQDTTLVTVTVIEAPGAVSEGLAVWFRANGSVTTSGTDVTEWINENSANLNVPLVTPTTGSPELLPANKPFNFNPSIEFNGEELSLTQLEEQDVLEDSEGTMFVVTTNAPGSFAFNSDAPSASLCGGLNCNNGFFTDTQFGTARTAYSQGLDANVANVLGFRSSVVALATQSTVNGLQSNSNAANQLDDSLDYDLIIGQGGYIGQVAEAISYDRLLSQTEYEQIESYLAIKYGVTLDQGTTGRNYVNSSNTIVFDANLASTGVGDFRPNAVDIAGIARDDGTVLDQMKSMSVNPSAIVTVAHGNDINNPTRLDDTLDYLVWGHDGSAATDVAFSLVGANAYDRLARIWRVQNTGDVGDVSIEFDLTGLGLNRDNAVLALLIDNDTDFTNATLHTTGVSIVGDVVTFTNVNFSDRDYFTLVLRQNVCGDGVQAIAIEVCEDANMMGGDGCSENCLLEDTAGPCLANTDCESGVCDASQAPATCEAANVCGNNLVEAGEACDDGDILAGDGCSVTCLIETGSGTCTGDADCVSGTCNTEICDPNPDCGNGVLDPLEACDDANIMGGDGCSETCLIEDNNGPCASNSQCLNGVCDQTVSPAVCEPAGLCGNGLIETAEGCDDGNTATNDGCNAFCQIENGAGVCTIDAQCLSNICNTTTGVCDPNPNCGNGSLENLFGESCDDSNIMGGDGCSENCLIEDTQGPCTANTDCVGGICDPTSNTCESADLCGNGVIESGEGCDDGGVVSGDGCSSACLIEDNLGVCASDSDCVSNTCDTAIGICGVNPSCGNGILEVNLGEACDDGNILGGDGCSENCLVEDDFMTPCSTDAQCVGGTCDLSAGVCAPSCDDNAQCLSGACNAVTGVCNVIDRCGNSLVETAEGCDDGNVASNDGCNSSCRIEDGLGTCLLDDDCASNSCDPLTNICDPNTLCGDGNIDTAFGESCDDGDAMGGDGCSENCLIEDNEGPCTTNNQCLGGICDLTSNTCESAQVCGNGLVEVGEGCDDGAVVSGDGCSSVCLVENNNGVCSSDSDCASNICDLATGVCGVNPNCGNGILETSFGEACDDSNTLGADGCSETCLIEDDFSTPCSQNEQCISGTCDLTTGQCAPSCNDNAQCQSGVCNSLTGVCNTADTCGNSMIETGEGCDDGNILPNDSCSAACLIEDSSGTCDSDSDCASNSCDISTGVCEVNPNCGNGTLETALGEACDDSNSSGGDGCSEFCLIEDNQGTCSSNQQCQSGVCNTSTGTCDNSLVCGNSVLESGEACDDGNFLPGDGCSASCLIEDNFTPCGSDSDCQSNSCNVATRTCNPNVLCGNGTIDALSGESCDDGNDVGGDGCSESCLIEDDLGICTLNNDCHGGICNPLTSICSSVGICGNGVVENAEGCDDGNNLNLDACSAACLIEDGSGQCLTDQDCLGSSCSLLTGICDFVSECGNGILEAGEGCDDNNANGNDGCSETCLVEDEQGPCSSNAVCASGICNVVTDTCSENNACGNSVVDSAEGCDDGNILNGDGCDANCLIEAGLGVCSSDSDCQSNSCDLATGLCDVNTNCGDLNVDSVNGESCDNDAGPISGDGCSNICLIESTAGVCFANTDCMTGVCNTVSAECAEPNTCGNSQIENSEGCDDANLDNADGCNDQCKIETGISGCDEDLDCASGQCDNEPGEIGECVGNFVLRSPFYVIWNSFIRQSNIAAFVNKTDDTDAVLNLELLDRFGNTLSNTSLTLAPREEFDVSMNDLPGYLPETYGSMRVTFDPPRSIDGNAGLYRFNPSVTENEFLMLREYENSTFGNSYASMNTFQPSLNSADSEYQVIHWLQVLNHNETTSKDFTVNRYDDVGALIDTRSFTVPAKGRWDLQAGHEDPVARRVGLVEVVPQDPNSPYGGELFRYGGNQIFGIFPDAFFFGISDTLKQGIPMKQFLSVSRAGNANSIIELTNLDTVSESIQVEVFDTATGTQIHNQIVNLGTYQQVHIITDSFLAPGQIAYALVTPLSGKEILAKNTVYFYRPDLSVSSAYTTGGRELLGGSLMSNYNTFLAQSNWLKLYNFNASTANMTLDVYNIDGTLNASQNFTINPNMGFDLNIETDLGIGLNSSSYGGYSLTSDTPLFGADNLRFNFSPGFDYVDIGKVLPVR